MRIIHSLLLIGLLTVAESQPLILDPAISPNGSFIAFSYQGDVWKVPATGGRADRLTIHEGYEGSPIWNESGEKIAFISDRFGNNDVFVMSASGGTPDRLTFHSANDAVSSFSSDGSILFNTRRLYAQVEREWEIYEVSALGGQTETRYMDAMGFDPIVSPDGSKVAFVRGTCRTAREAYRGPANRDIWIFDRSDNTYSKLTDFDGNDFSPKWINNDAIYFISSRSGKYNVHQMSLSGEESRLTNETSFGINSFSTTADGGRIIYQSGDQVYDFNVSTNIKTSVEIDVSTDFRFDPIVSKKVSNDVDEFSISPNGKLMAYIVRGDIYVTRNDKEDSRSVNVSRGPARDRDVQWLDDERLVFVSDVDGQNDLYVLKSNDASEPDLFRTLKIDVLRVTNSPEEEFGPQVSPDGKRIAYRQGRGKLLTADISSGGALSNINILQDGWDTPGSVSWSPDSKWLAYSLSDLTFNEEVYIHAADNSKSPVNVSMHPKYDGNPVWSPDGSKLGFTSMRNNGDSDIWFAWLTKNDWERSKEEWKRDDLSEDEDEEENEVVEVKIDFDGLYKRLQQVTSYTGNESDLAFNMEGDQIYYTIGGAGRQDFKIDRDLYKIKWDGSKRETIISGNKSPNSLTLSDEGDFVYTNTKGGKIVRVKTKDDKTETLSVSSQVNINYQEERSQIFEEGWRALGAGFYDPKFHGQNWDSLKIKYRPIALKASTKEDFQYVYNLMLGQLNASHMGLYRGENQKQTQSQKTGFLGIEGEDRSGGFVIKSVLPGSPASRIESALKVGDVITSVNQEKVEGKNFYAMLTDKSNNPVLLNVANDGSSREVVIWPTSSLSTQLYDAWVEDRRKLTDEYSNGRLGYLHIRGMNWSSFERFERELMAAGYGKEGIVIDVRFNGGGWTTDFLMAVLNVKQHAYTIPRGAAADLDNEHLNFKETYPFAERLPLSAWTKPSIAMCNENSYSNAEIFSHAYKTLGLGTLVGRPTFGAVISTGGWGLVDGSFVRMPFRAWYVKATEENMEHGPAVPDIEVFNPPGYKAKNIDPQLERSVTELLSQIDD